jgi:hypothetical protein
MSGKLTENQRREIIDKYLAGAGSTSLGKEYGVHENSIIKLLKKQGVMRPKAGRKIMPEDEVDIVKMYEDGKSAQEIGNHFNVSHSLILKYLERNNIGRRSAEEAHRIYPINEDFFDNIDTEEKAYFLGFLYADGNVQDKISNHHIRIELAREDRDILVKLTKLIFKENSNDRITDYARKRDFGNGEKEYDYSYFTIHSKYMVKQLVKLGCTEAKSLTLKWPEWLADSELQKHFIRGYYDGDGGLQLTDVKERSAFLRIISTSDMCKSMHKIINSATGANFSYNQAIENKDVWTINTSGNRQIKNILMWLYTDATIWLKRKYKLYEDLLKQIENTNKLIEAGTQGYQKRYLNK